MGPTTNERQNMKTEDKMDAELKTEEELLVELAKAAVKGRLLLFVGTGFSRAAVPIEKEPGKPTVLSWTELLREICCKMQLDPNQFILPARAKYSPPTNASDTIEIPDIQYACPAIASRICEEWTRHHHQKDVNSGVRYMKDLIAGLATWVPLKRMRSRIRTVLQAIQPAGIITTNYDTVLEAALDIKGKSIERNELFFPGNNARIPIWHIHGSIQVPNSIVVTQEDYQLFFRPEDYVQRKLTMLLREYTTLFIGYSLGDTNIKTAIDWAMNVYTTMEAPTPIQVRLIHDKTDGKVDHDSSLPTMYSVKTADCLQLLEKLGRAVADEKRKRDNVKKLLASALSSMKNTAGSLVRTKTMMEKQISDIRSVLKHQAKDAMFLILPQVQSLLADAKHRAGEYGNFDAYANWLHVLLILLEEIPQAETPPAMIALLVEELEEVLSMTGTLVGQSFSAERLWKSEGPKIPREKREYYLKLAQQLSLPHLEKKLRQTMSDSK